jgi:hypothetical protein
MKKGQMNKLDKLWSAKIREFGRCEVCSKSGCKLDSHHYIGRRNRNLRWDLRNGFCLCSGCHTMKAQSAHQDPEWFREWALKLRGQIWLDYIIEKSRVSCMASKQDYDEILKGLE